MLLKEKNNGGVKVRAVPNGKQSHEWTAKEDTDSPTEANDSITITAENDSK